LKPLETSIIIPTCRRPHSLRRVLEGIVRQTANQERYEVLVIDNGCDDATSQVVEIFKDRIRYVQCLTESRPGLHAARNHGTRAARAEILMFADDDILPFPGWIETVRETFLVHPETVLVGGKSLPLYESDPPSWMHDLWEDIPYGKVNGWFSLIDLGADIKPIPADLVYGCNFSIRKEIVERCGGFHPDALPWNLKHLRGDGETHVSRWIEARGLLCMYHPEASVQHVIVEERMNWHYLCRRAFLQGISDSYSATRENPALLHRLPLILRRVLYVASRNVFWRGKGVKRHWLHYIHGMFWHQYIVSRDVELRRWVMKEVYD